MVSYQDSCHFIENILQMPSDWKCTLERDKLEFLSLYMRYHAIKIPFQNISMGAVAPNERCAPDEAAIIRQGFTGQGGSCLHVNYFTKLILEAIGIDCFIVQGTYANADFPAAHLMTIVKVKDDELYLIEVGGSIPIVELVPLHKLPFRTQPARGFQFEFREISKGLFGRYCINGSPFGGAFVDKSESLRTWWDLEPKKLSDFKESAHQVFTNSTSSMLRSPTLFRYFSNAQFAKVCHEFSECNNYAEITIRTTTSEDKESFDEIPTDFVIFCKKTVLVADTYVVKHRKSYLLYKDMVLDIKKYFPMLDVSEIRRAMDAFDSCESDLN